MSPIPTLHTARLVLRAPGADDFAPMAAFYASDRCRFVGGRKSAEDAWRQLACEIGHWALRGYGRWIVQERDSGATAGIVGLWNPEGWPEPELGWDLFEGYEGRGYATEAALAARGFAYGTLGWASAISLIAPENTASRAVAGRLGATCETRIDTQRFGPVDIFRHPAPEALA